MPYAPPHICGCGHRIPAGTRCPCQMRNDKDRKARAEAARPSARQRGYDSKWDTARTAYLKANPVCVRCSAPAAVVDHKTPHKGDQHLFWSRSNWQALCRPCHDRWKQSLERRGAIQTTGTARREWEF